MGIKFFFNVKMKNVTHFYVSYIYNEIQGVSNDKPASAKLLKKFIADMIPFVKY